MSSNSLEQQTIVSEDKKLEILHHKGMIDMFGSFLIEGAVKNLTAESDIKVTIHVDYYDMNGVHIDSEIEKFDIPFPRGSRAFYIVYSGQRHDDIRSYKLLI